MEVGYKTDLYSSYLLISVDKSLSHNKYSFKMLENNKIKGVLDSKKRIEDGKAYLYLDITGKKSLCQEYREREMNFRELTEFFQSLIIILESLREYLLTEKMVILEPEFIYKDMEDGSLWLSVIPWEREEQYPLRKLAEFLLEKINHLEENGVSAAYHFYRSQSQPQFSIYQFLEILEKENILNRQKESNNEIAIPEKEVEKEEVISEKNTETEMVIDKKEQRSILGIISMACAIGVLCMVFLPFTQKNQKISCIVLAVILIIVGIGTMIIEAQRKRKISREMVDSTLYQNQDFYEETEDTIFFMDNSSINCLRLQWQEKGKIKEMEIKELPFTIGKKKDQVSLVLSDASVSRVHCRLVESRGEPALTDLDSTNGTYLNGIRINKEEIIQIEKNDEILVGKVKLLVV